MSGAELAALKAIAGPVFKFTQQAWERHREQVLMSLARAVLDGDEELSNENATKVEERLTRTEGAEDLVRCMLMEEETQKLWAYELLLCARVDHEDAHFHEHLRFVRMASNSHLDELRKNPISLLKRNRALADDFLVVGGLERWARKLTPSLVSLLKHHGFVSHSPWASEDRVQSVFVEFVRVMGFHADDFNVPRQGAAR